MEEAERLQFMRHDFEERFFRYIPQLMRKPGLLEEFCWLRLHAQHSLDKVRELPEVTDAEAVNWTVAIMDPTITHLAPDLPGLRDLVHLGLTLRTLLNPRQEPVKRSPS